MISMDIPIKGGSSLKSNYIVDEEGWAVSMFLIDF